MAARTLVACHHERPTMQAPRYFPRTDSALSTHPYFVDRASRQLECFQARQQGPRLSHSGPHPFFPWEIAQPGFHEPPYLIHGHGFAQVELLEDGKLLIVLGLSDSTH